MDIKRRLTGLVPASSIMFPCSFLLPKEVKTVLVVQNIIIKPPKRSFAIRVLLFF
jgi:hypothetical protein